MTKIKQKWNFGKDGIFLYSLGIIIILSLASLEGIGTLLILGNLIFF